MKVTVNGDPIEAPDGTSVAELIELMGLSGGPVAVERNGEVVRRAHHAQTPLSEGDQIEIVHFVGGG